MYSVIGTLNLNGIDVRRWLEAWLAACARTAAGRRSICRPGCPGRWTMHVGANWRRDMTGSVECRYHGRDFTADEMALLRALIAGPPALNRHALSKEFCRRIGWYKADGGLKDMMARVVMLGHAQRRGGSKLPPPKWPRPPRRPTTFGPDTEPPLPPPPDTLQAVPPAQPATDRRLQPRGQALERVRRPATTTSATRPWSAPRCATPCTPTTARRWPCSASPRRLDPRPARPLHRLVAADAREEPAARRRQPPLPDPCLGPHPQPRLAHPRPRPPAPARRLDRGHFRIAIRHADDHSGTRIVLPVPEATRHDSTERLPFRCMSKTVH